MRFTFAHKPVILLTLLSLLASVLSAPVSVRAQDAPPSASDLLHISVQGQETAITYAATLGQLTAADAAQLLPTQRLGGYELPLHYLTLAVTTAGQPQVNVQEVTAVPLAAPPQPAAPETPTAIGWEPDPNYTPETPALPTQPIFIARQGILGGQRYVVIAVSPIFAQEGVAHIATSLRATVPGATAASAEMTAALAANSPQDTRSAAVQVPVNAAALTNSYKLTVSRPGLQEVLYSELGLSSEPASLRLVAGGAEIAVEKASDRLRFYAPEVGDRWTASTAYWLTLETGALMGQRPAVPTGPAIGAYEEGEWRDNRLYEAGYPGADGDHWFHADLKVPALLPAGSDVTQITPVTVPVTINLPLRTGPSTYQVISTGYLVPSSDAYCNTPYQLNVQSLAGAAWVETQVVDWQPNPDCKRLPTSTAVITSDAPLSTMLLRLNPNGYYNSGIKLEAVTWRRPVELDFQNSAGAEFVTDAGAGSLVLRNLPASWQLYDVTQPAQPQVVANGAGGEYTLNQAADAPASRYLLANLLTPQKPAAQSHAPTQFGNVKAANALYIGPAAFADELTPLLRLRAEQGFTPLFVDIQAIYDLFSHGQVSAVAVRNFLRQESDWQNRTRKISVVLVGDATMDPFAYGGVANETLVAAWMDDVDPYQGAAGNDGEAACDACIAQLDGDDPVTGDNQGVGKDWFAADVWIGRLPVRSEQETADLVAKLVTYDTAANGGAWRSRKVFMADNYIRALDGQQNAQPDEAGDFAALSDHIVHLLPNPASTRRIYYDPAPNRQLTSTPATGGYYQTVERTLPENWRIKDIIGINAQVISTLSQGAGLVTYNGHSNHFYFARTEDVHATGVGDKWLLNAPEVSLLGNTGKEFVMLSMTCYTSQFVKPTANGTLDEWLIRHKNGGAAAVWGPTGLSVVSGHELLQQGFVQKLAGSTTSDLRMGELVEAGYTHLLLENGPLDPLMTFVLLGDPLTKARIPTRDLYLPAIRR